LSVKSTTEFSSIQRKKLFTLKPFNYLLLQLQYKHSKLSFLNSYVLDK